MTSREIRAELALKQIEFEKALTSGMPHPELINVYRQLKELQYRLLMAETNERQTEIIE